MELAERALARLKPGHRAPYIRDLPLKGLESPLNHLHSQLDPEIQGWELDGKSRLFYSAFCKDLTR